MFGYIATFFGTITALTLSLNNLSNMLHDVNYITAQFHYFVAISVFFVYLRLLIFISILF